ncbi:USH1C [Cordylochernes scorpioides]|uniref:USH1C n=1 Tax=Cordylochernes scorpioides TaxID=51811 RepID=A0ABY6L2P5_9ARAC|nr:USH1C [Cordylochernes scorpioides]
MGLIPIKESKSDAITWRIVDSGSPTSSLVESSNGSSSSHGDLIQVHIAVNGATSLGCSIVKGPPEVPGIFFSMIKPHGLAEQAGLCVGDQIISMNRTSFIDIEFAEVAAVDITVSGRQSHQIQPGSPPHGPQGIRPGALRVDRNVAL